MDKKAIFKLIIESLRKAEAEAERARDRAQAEANSHVGRMESRYDTWKEENQAEVTAQELRIQGYHNGIGQIEYLLQNEANLKVSPKVRVGSVVQLETENGDKKYYILSPAGGGVVIKDGEVMEAFTYEVVDKQENLKSSKEYMSLLQNAARKFNFPKEYQSYLASFETS